MIQICLKALLGGTLAICRFLQFNNNDCFFCRPVEVDEPVVPEESGASVPFSDAFESVYQKDAYLLFRALCKLSTKGVSDEVVTGSDAVIHQNK